MNSFIGSAASFVGVGEEQLVEDDLKIITSGLEITGWQRIVVRTGLQLMPWSFLIETTEFYPGDANAIAITPGADCEVYLGQDLVITGYIVTVDREVRPNGHVVRVTGASKSIDLVEPSADLQTFQINNTGAEKLTAKLCADYGIPVTMIGYSDTIVIPQFAVNLTDTPYSIIDRVCRAAAVLFYDRPDGGIVLSKVGSEQAASGFVEGEHVEQWSYTSSMEARFSQIRVVLLGTAPLFNAPDMADLGGQMSDLTNLAKATDAGVGRHRSLILVAEQGDYLYTVAKQRAQWEVNRRYARSQVVSVTADSWRDASGKLWTVNTLAPVYLPSVKCTPRAPLLIAEVVFRLDDDGRHADVTLLPPAAFIPEPIILTPLNSGAAQALNEQVASATPPAATKQPLPPGASSGNG